MFHESSHFATTFHDILHFATTFHETLHSATKHRENLHSADIPWKSWLCCGSPLIYTSVLWAEHTAYFFSGESCYYPMNSIGVNIWHSRVLHWWKATAQLSLVVYAYGMEIFSSGVSPRHKRLSAVWACETTHFTSGGSLWQNELFKRWQLMTRWRGLQWSTGLQWQEFNDIVELLDGISWWCSKICGCCVSVTQHRLCTR